MHLLATYRVRQFKLTLSMLKNSIQKKYQKAPEKEKKKRQSFVDENEIGKVLWYDELCASLMIELEEQS